jgi:hypothetical protein
MDDSKERAKRGRAGRRKEEGQEREKKEKPPIQAARPLVTALNRRRPAQLGAAQPSDDSTWAHRRGQPHVDGRGEVEVVPRIEPPTAAPKPPRIKQKTTGRGAPTPQAQAGLGSCAGTLGGQFGLARLVSSPPPRHPIPSPFGSCPCPCLVSPPTRSARSWVGRHADARKRRNLDSETRRRNKAARGDQRRRGTASRPRPRQRRTTAARVTGGSA